MLALFDAQLVGALPGDQGDHVVVPDLEGNFDRHLSLDYLGDGAR